MEKHNIYELSLEYVKSMTEKELKAYHIAKEHLGDSFQLEKSIGFLEWLKTQKQKQKSDPQSSSA
jgi:hypothetical protein